MIATLTRQETFTKMVTGLAAQGWKQALGPHPDEPASTQCLYRAPGGLKCAVGQLIPDEWFVETDNYTGLATLLRGSEELTAFLGVPVTVRDASGFIEEVDQNSDVYQFLAEAQRCHDNAEGPEQMKENFINLGNGWGLKWPTEVPL